MDTQLNKQAINVYETPTGILVYGQLPGIEIQDATITQDHVHVYGVDQHKQVFRQEIPLKKPINPEHSITTFHNHTLKMVLPWRNQE